MLLDPQTRELTIKLVYYGAALSGKTTNLQAIHRLANGDARGRLMTLETRDDRTLFFDLLPLQLRMGEMNIRLKIFTVPGQVIHATTRKLVLTGVDGIAFIADSQRSEIKTNAAAFQDLTESLTEIGLNVNDVPLVIQFNKRDMQNVREDEEIDALGARGTEPVYKAVARNGVGVIETLTGLVNLTWQRLDRLHGLEKNHGLSGAVLIHALTACLTSTGSIPPAKPSERP